MQVLVQNDVALLTALLEEGLDPNSNTHANLGPDARGNTQVSLPIIYVACQSNAASCVKKLLEARADAAHEFRRPGCHHRDGAVTPLDRASRPGR